jgi:hypothetical protein
MWKTTDPEESFRNKVIWWSAIIVGAAVIGVGAYFRLRSPPPAPAQPAPSPAAQQQSAPLTRAAPPAPVIQHPVPAQSGPTASVQLPTLDHSDPTVLDALTRLAGRPAVARFLVPKTIIRHIVVTVDNLPRAKVAANLRPVRPTPGQTVVIRQGRTTLLGSGNYARYTPFVKVIGAMDMKSLAALYFRLYPLFQRAYQSLGYPHGYFNDRLVEAIDSMLATPQVQQPIELVQGKVFWQFADPKLEALPAGQKLLLRMGPHNAAVIEAKLRQLRQLITSPPGSSP